MPNEQEIAFIAASLGTGTAAQLSYLLNVSGYSLDYIATCMGTCIAHLEALMAPSLAREAKERADADAAASTSTTE